jgi:NADP-dependent 3-hydroxy acid dehydrogenase YdfG
VNVLGTVRLTKALLPALRASGAGDVLFVGSTAGLTSYEGGASYTAAKHGVHTLAETLRLELNGEPVRVMEIAPGMVRTEEFSLNRLGSTDAADSVYRGVREPLLAEDVADCIAWAITRPHHVNIDLMVVRPLAQAAQHKVHRQ